MMKLYSSILIIACIGLFILIDFRLDWLRASYLFAGSILILKRGVSDGTRRVDRW
jgi:hypothetical protein